MPLDILPYNAVIQKLIQCGYNHLAMYHRTVDSFQSVIWVKARRHFGACYMGFLDKNGPEGLHLNLERHL